MKRAGILNSDISRVLSYMGHTDLICVGDCGLPRCWQKLKRLNERH